jgi:hypothetical protein
LIFNPGYTLGSTPCARVLAHAALGPEEHGAYVLGCEVLERCARMMVEPSILGRKFSGVVEVSLSMYVFGSRESEEAKGRKRRTSDDRDP